MPDERKPKRPWTGFQYLVLVVAAILVAWFLIRPVGQQITGVFQTLTDAFAHR